MASSVTREIWFPQTPDERNDVFNQMQAMIVSSPFRNSKRYPAFFEFVVRNTLNGHLDILKERTIGIQVFDRLPDYDTNADPIVRVTAGEIRKRIAQFYDTEGQSSLVRIDLPAGSYVAEFHKITPLPVAPPETWPAAGSISRVAIDSVSPVACPVPLDSEIHGEPRFGRSTILRLLAILVIVISGYASWRLIRPGSERKQMWGPIFRSNAPILVVLGQTDPALIQALNGFQPAAETLSQDIHRPDKFVALHNTMAIAHICGIVDAHQRACQVGSARTVSLSDLRNSSVVLIGAFDNSWTLRLLAPLRFTFSRGPAQQDGNLTRRRYIVDKKSGKLDSDWSVDFNVPPRQYASDFAIIGRFRSDTTDGNILVAAGIGPVGTESAAEFVTSTAMMQQFAAMAPRNWNGMNMEAVLQTEVIDGRSGHTKVVAADFW